MQDGQEAQQTKPAKIRLILDLDPETHHLTVSGHGGNYNFSVAMLKQALEYYETMRLEAVIQKAVVDALQAIADQRRVTSILSGKGN